MSAKDPSSVFPPAASAEPAATFEPKRSRFLAVAGETQPAAAAPSEPRKYWRSLQEKAGDAALARATEQEFPPGASELDGVSRRNFMQLLGASAALSGAACYRPNQKIVPFVRRPPEVTPGNSLHFASAYALEGYATGIIVESHAGRPTKVEGNPEHPDSLGATSVYDQALTLGLYDDDRAKALRHQGKGLAWRQLLSIIAGLSEKHAADGGAKLRFLVAPLGSPLLADQRTRILQKFPNAKFVSFLSASGDGAAEGAQLAFGRPLEPHHDLTAAKVVVSLDADFLGEGFEQKRLGRQFGVARTPGPEMNRLYVAEPCPTPTGTLADHRLRVRGSEILGVAQALAAELGKDTAAASLAPLAAGSAGGTWDARWIAALAKDLLANRGRSVVIAGRRQPAAVHALVNAINVALGNVGKTVSFWAGKTLDAATGLSALRQLVEDVAAGQVETLVITAENPVYGAPADFKLDRLLARVPNVIYLGLYEDETALLAKTFVPRTHVLESWGDAQALDGTVSIIQPLISPLWLAHTESELLSGFLGEGDRGAHALLREFWQRRSLAEGRATAADFEGTWETWLAKGFIDKTAGQAETAVLAGGLGEKVSAAIAALPKGTGGLEVAFAVDLKVFDGRFGNNAWLQELPHPITKMTWDNAVLLSKSTAGELGVTTGDVVTLSVGDRSVEGPVYVQVGHADQAVTVALGYGRNMGRVATGVGFNAGILRTSASPWFVAGGNVAKAGRRHRFGITQEHWAMEGRDPVRSGPLAQLLDKQSKLHETLETQRGPLPTLHPPVDYSKQQYKWGMSIDLSKCTGCSVCVIACQSENNIPVVGRENVRIGREMQWLRIDLYYDDSKDANNPEMLTQPVACVHCETAPCEYVCPVNATVHSDEGLNEMVYNRCIGTRYCSNNCPYKARRFNFLDYRPSTSPVARMVANPDVTVRSRGIMEKCTYCVQRIERARIDTRVEGRAIVDGEIQTACQQACPTRAIEFGSLNDPNAVVTKLHQDDRRYDLLHELSTRPRTAYLARVRNPNPELG